jgi:uncharacterized repeat protein (TIGR03803 family)
MAYCQYSKLLNFNNPFPGTGPKAMIIEGDYLYGANSNGGLNDHGILYKLNIVTHSCSVLLEFDSVSNGSWPASLILDSSYIYGTTRYGVGNNSSSLIFKIKTDGSGFEVIKSINPITDQIKSPEILIKLIAGSTIYGIAKEYGTDAQTAGSIFRVNNDGSGFRKIFEFDNSVKKGNNPQDLLLAGNTLFGISYEGGLNDAGTLFRINTDGAGFVKLFDFDNYSTGIWPASICLVNDKIYGQTCTSSWSENLVYSIDTTGANYRILYSLPLWPSGKILYNSNILYCLCSNEMFSISLNDHQIRSLINANLAVDFYSAMLGPLLSGNRLYVATNTVLLNDEMNYGSIYKVQLDNFLPIIIDTVRLFSYDTIQIKKTVTTHLLVYDTVHLQLTDTTHFPIYDSIHIQTTDTLHIPVYETIHISIIDTTHIIVYDTISDCSKIGLNNQDTTRILFYPNPTKGILNCELNSLYEENTILSIYDLAGILVYIKLLDAPLTEINLNDLHNGFYTAQILNSKVRHYFRIIKNNAE